MLRPRFLIEAGVIIAVAVVAGIAQLGTWSIVALVAGVWLLVAVLEIVLWARNARARPAAAPEPVVVAAPPPPEPKDGDLTPTAANESSSPEPEPTAAAASFTSDEPREWNLWELERLVREHRTDDVAQNEERAYLLLYLREFAGPDGALPADFDGLVRDAFGELLHVVAT
jgi:hypothetical protein